jgi:Pyruvate/2-oxoglutarate dehydrogenase complex, dehydrogenase (E1) component, eukaryotic type, alpha subunit
MKKKFKKEDYIKIYRKMLQIRRFEERAAQLYGMGHIGGFCHLYIDKKRLLLAF